MKTIKDLTVKMTFRVGLADLKVSDSIMDGLEKISEMNNIDDMDIGMTKDKNIQEAWEWLSNNISDDDAFSWEYEIEDLTV